MGESSRRQLHKVVAGDMEPFNSSSSRLSPLNSTTSGSNPASRSLLCIMPHASRRFQHHHSIFKRLRQSSLPVSADVGKISPSFLRPIMRVPFLDLVLGYFSQSDELTKRGPRFHTGFRYQGLSSGPDQHWHCRTDDGAWKDDCASRITLFLATIFLSDLCRQVIRLSSSPLPQTCFDEFQPMMTRCSPRLKEMVVALPGRANSGLCSVCGQGILPVSHPCVLKVETLYRFSLANFTIRRRHRRPYLGNFWPNCFAHQSASVRGQSLAKVERWAEKVNTSHSRRFLLSPVRLCGALGRRSSDTNFQFIVLGRVNHRAQHFHLRLLADPIKNFAVPSAMPWRCCAWSAPAAPCRHLQQLRQMQQIWRGGQCWSFCRRKATRRRVHRGRSAISVRRSTALWLRHPGKRIMALGNHLLRRHGIAAKVLQEGVGVLAGLELEPRHGILPRNDEYQPPKRLALAFHSL